jgi:hypothetical protein
LTPNEENFIKGRAQIVEEEKKKGVREKETVKDFNKTHIELIR